MAKRYERDENNQKFMVYPNKFELDTDTEMNKVRDWMLSYSGVDPIGTSRKRECVNAKQIFIGICNHLGIVSPNVVSRFLDVHHATVIHHTRKFRDLIEVDKQMRIMWDEALSNFVPTNVIHRRKCLKANIRNNIRKLQELNKKL